MRAVESGAALFLEQTEAVVGPADLEIWEPCSVDEMSARLSKALSPFGPDPCRSSRTSMYERDIYFGHCDSQLVEQN